MQIAVLAGGLGTRLRPITEKLPKCMTPVGGKPFLYHLLRLLKDRGAEEIVLCTGYLGEQVEPYFRDGSDIGLKLLYSRETHRLLGTGGALKLAEPLLNGSFLVVNGDTYLDVDYKGIYEYFNTINASALIVASHNAQNSRCDLAVDDGLYVTAYDKTNPDGKHYVNAGVMGLRKGTLADIKAGETISLETEIFQHLIERREVRAITTTEQFYDIGSFAGLGVFGNTLKEARI